MRHLQIWEEEEEFMVQTPHNVGCVPGSVLACVGLASQLAAAAG